VEVVVLSWKRCYGNVGSGLKFIDVVNDSVPPHLRSSLAPLCGQIGTDSAPSGLRMTYFNGDYAVLTTKRTREALRGHPNYKANATRLIFDPTTPKWLKIFVRNTLYSDADSCIHIYRALTTFKPPTMTTLLDRLLDEDVFASVHTGRCLHQLGTYYDLTRKDHVRAQRAYVRSVHLDPACAECAHDFAVFLDENNKDAALARRMYDRAIRLEPGVSTFQGDFAYFLSLQGDMKGAEEHYGKALQLPSVDANTLCSYALFLKNVKRDEEGARSIMTRAKQTDATNNCVKRFGSSLLKLSD